MDAPTRLSSGQVRKILGVTRRQLQYWHSTGLIEGANYLKHRRYGPRELIVVKAIEILRGQGLSLQRCRAAIEKLRKNLGGIRDESLLTCVIVPGSHGCTILASNDGIWSVVGGENVIMVRKFCLEIREFSGEVDR